MHLYNCKVRLSGSLYNEVPKSQISAAEIIVLRTIHGADSVADIVPAGEAKMSSIQLRGELTLMYGKALRTIDEIRSINGIFGVAGELPEHLPGFAPEKKGKAKAEPKPVIDEADLADDDEIARLAEGLE
ncbi:hypothetical protein GGQ64_005344 [Rhizobium azooxidifex]|uniref:Uncharacterized protein n=1 Tax=Mycoplana azooxidifex TaxID=1636188 RepID=A0A7W6DGA9_9HYPH|nr:hypothetical protein [Mycoplana azooxidifex]MBB3980097.1 hypothetical protein [Mycoplana azooxidifex]